MLFPFFENKILADGPEIVGRCLGRRAWPEAPLLIRFSSENASFEVQQAFHGAHPTTTQYFTKIKKGGAPPAAIF